MFGWTVSLMLSMWSMCSCVSAPSVGPNMTVLKTSSSGVVLKWDPVPLDKLHGFIQNYTVLYSINGKDKSKMQIFIFNMLKSNVGASKWWKTPLVCEGVKVGADVEQISLSGLTEGLYNICVMAHTAVGGAAGPCQMVVVGKNEAIWIDFFLPV